MRTGHDQLKYENVDDESGVGNSSGDSEEAVTENDSEDPPHFMRHGENQRSNNYAPSEIQNNRQQRVRN